MEFLSRCDLTCDDFTHWILSDGYDLVFHRLKLLTYKVREIVAKVGVPQSQSHRSTVTRRIANSTVCNIVRLKKRISQQYQRIRIEIDATNRSRYLPVTIRRPFHTRLTILSRWEEMEITICVIKPHYRSPSFYM